MRARVLRGGWFYGPRLLKAGDEVEAPKNQIRDWVRDGYVQPIEAPPKREEKAETAEAAPAPENATKRTAKPKRVKKRGG